MPWNEITRRHYRREGFRYASDLTDTEWSLIEPFILVANLIGRPRKTDMRDLVNALFYICFDGLPVAAASKRVMVLVIPLGACRLAWRRRRRSAELERT